MKVLRTFILLLICYTSQAQQPFSRIATPLVWTQGGFDSLFLPNHDTIIPKDKSKAWVVVKDTTIYIWKGLRWQAFTGGGSGSGGVPPTNIYVGTIAQLRASNTVATISYISTDIPGQWKDIGLSDGQYSDNGATHIITANGRVLERKHDGPINVQWFNVLPTNTASQNNTAIAAMIAAVPAASTLYVPNGTYQYSATITITKTLSFEGESKFGAIFKNIGVGVDAWHINANVERGKFHNIGLWGNGTTAYGTNATTGKGITFGANAIHWNFDNIWMRGHGDHFIYADSTGSVNNLNFNNSEFEYGPKSAFHVVQSDFNNQINAINVSGCNLAGFAGNIMELWGQSLTVENCTIQGSKKRGISVDASLGHASSSAVGIRLIHNYFELCNWGNIYTKAFVDNLGQYRYIADLTVMGNYGTYSVIPGDTVNTLLYAAFEADAPSFYSQDNIQYSSLWYVNNAFILGQASKAIFDGHNVLTNNSHIQKGVTSSGDFDKYINLGRATIEGEALPRISTTERNEISAPKKGDVVFDSTAKEIFLYNGTIWKAIGDKPSQWSSVLDDDGLNSVSYTGNLIINSPVGKPLRLNTSAGQYTWFPNALVAPGSFVIRSSATGYAQLRDDYADFTAANGTASMNQNAGTKTSVIADDGFIQVLINNLEKLRFNATNATFRNSTVSGSRAVSDSQFIPRGQMSDSLRALEIANTFILRNSGGTGDTLMSNPYSNLAIMKRITINGASVVKTDTTLTYTVNAPLNGTVTITGDGSSTSFTIPLSVSGMSSSSRVFVENRSAGMSPVTWVDVSDESITVHYLTAPTSGSKTLNYMIIP